MGSSISDRDAANAAQWQEDARLVLDRLELDIVDVAFERSQGDEIVSGPVSFMSEEMERRLAVSVAATSIASNCLRFQT